MRKDKHSYRIKAWKLQRSRSQWKSRRKPTIRMERPKRRRKTILTAEQDVKFTAEFNISGLQRKRMKKFFRLHGVDFFSKDAERDRILLNIAPNEHWTYKKVGFLIGFQNFR